MYKIIGADGKEYGPVSLEQMRRWIADGRVSPQTRVQTAGAAEWKTFDAFQAALAASTITAVPVPDAEGDGYDDGYRVTWEAPKRGTVTFGWSDPLTVGGADVPLTWEWRHDNPFLQTRFNDTVYDIQADGQRLYLDFATGARLGSTPPAPTP